jgi:deoxyribonuclease V
LKVEALHPWPTTSKEAIALQRELAGRILLTPIPAGVSLLAGLDISISHGGSHLFAGVVVWDRRLRTVVETQVVRVACAFPYVPGLLSFREIPGVIEVVRRLETRPDVFLFDGQGLAHPRRIGLASHAGLWLGVPTVGCAKSRLCGVHREPGLRRNSAARLMLDGEQVGVVLRTRDGVKPLYISPGHLCDLASARRIALSAATRFRLPEPTRLAHQLVTRAKMGVV